MRIKLGFMSFSSLRLLLRISFKYVRFFVLQVYLFISFFAACSCLFYMLSRMYIRTSSFDRSFNHEIIGVVSFSLPSFFQNLRDGFDLFLAHFHRTIFVHLYEHRTRTIF